MILKLVLFIILTLTTQIGGIILVVLLPVLKPIKASTRYLKVLKQFLLLSTSYLLIVLFAVPPLAKLNHRAPLPCWGTETQLIKPANLGYCLLLRNYVTPSAKQYLLTVAKQFQTYYPNTPIRYLDANFPFLNGFPLPPHLSHHDGRKVDLAYFYQDTQTKVALDTSPSWLGYWVYVAPDKGQESCSNQTSALRWDFEGLQPYYKDYELDEARTRTLVKLLASNAQKIFLEPHLQKRLQLTSSKIKFQGCHAARHDDHIHVQW